VLIVNPKLRLRVGVQVCAWCYYR